MKKKAALRLSPLVAFLLAALMLFTSCGVKPNPVDTDSQVSSEISSETTAPSEGTIETGDSESLVTDESGTVATDGTTATDKEGKPVTTKSGGGKNTTTTQKDTIRTTPTTKGGGTNLKPVEDGLDFGGQTFTKTIVGATPASTTRRVAAFEKAYNCKIKLVRLEWETYNAKVATSITSGQPYDICSLENYFFPECVTSLDLYEPLDSYLNDADIYGNAANPDKIGIDKNLSEYFRYNGKLYGVVAHGVSTNGVGSVYPVVLYYNKKMMADAGFTGKKDPLQMYKDGKWTWKAFEEMAKEIMLVSEPGKVVAGQDFVNQAQHILWSNDVKVTKVVNGKVTGDLGNSTFINALNGMAKWFTDKDAFVKSSTLDPTKEFINGNQYMFCKNSAEGPLSLMPQVEKSTAFDKKISNLGVVPFPTGPDNTTGGYSCTNLCGRGAAKGSKDPRVAIAYAKFQERFYELDPMNKTNKYQYDAETKAMLDEMSKNIITPLPNYKTTSLHTYGIMSNIVATAIGGGDISKAINDNKDAFQSCIDYALKQK